MRSINNKVHSCFEDCKLIQTKKIVKRMAVSIITPEDLNEFKDDLLSNIKELINHQSGKRSKKWLKSPEVRELLSISLGTLQNLRINGTLPYTKIGGVIYYDHEEIMKIMEENSVNKKL